MQCRHVIPSLLFPLRSEVLRSPRSAEGYRPGLQLLINRALISVARMSGQP
ncbi:hypothetical protein D187_006280 [Cystobacter fuscus DSM 2262]|uniref:Uncharacterized protein n=1 Tax=Cystobacter fuscus (strain ATCC 25194 / DSM 2262 / NBRC 100088 / M29) TaxID=1242864 RepID=S9PEQ2_CYSF2|nr:hypothetical protein D187_006280 [Cystobacter fuscus DSM 2262]